jgi:hypothetical protein
MVRTAGLIVATSATTSTLGADLTLSLIAATGHPAPGTDGVFADLAQTDFTDDGSAAFSGVLELGGTVTDHNNTGAWSSRSGSVLLEAREGDAVPVFPGEFYRGAFVPLLNASGEITLYAAMETSPGGVESGRAVWSDRNGAFEAVVRSGDPAPGVTGGMFASLPVAPIFADSGAIAFRAQLVQSGGVNSTNDTGYWSDESGSLSLVAREGEAAPGSPGHWGDFAASAFDGDPNGKLEITGGLALENGVVDLFSDGFIATNRTGVLTVLARESAGAPGTAQYFGGPFTTDPTPRVESETATVFSAPLKNAPGFSATSGSGIWSDRSGTLELVLRNGAAAPGTSGVFKTFFEPRQNSLSEIAFRAAVTLDDGMGGTVDRIGVWAERDGQFELIALEGESAPGTDSVFGSLSSALTSYFGFSDVGAVLLWGRLDTSVGTVTTDDDYAIWLTDPDGVLTLILREGDQVDLLGDGADVRTVGEPTFSTGEVSRLNNLHEALLTVDFTDDSRALITAGFDTVPFNPADFDMDGDVDGPDLAFLLSSWGSSTSAADINGDGVVDGPDLAFLLSAWTGSL